MFEELVVFPGDERLGRQGTESVVDTLKMTFDIVLHGSKRLLRFESSSKRPKRGWSEWR